MDGSHQAVANPRNTKQVENIQSKKREKQSLSKDDIYNLVLLAYQLDMVVGDYVLREISYIFIWKYSDLQDFVYGLMF